MIQPALPHLRTNLPGIALATGGFIIAGALFFGTICLSLLPGLLVGFILLALCGGLIGSLQARVLKPWLPRALRSSRWIWASATGWGIGSAVGIVTAGRMLNYGAPIIFPLACGLILGLAIGMAQWLALGRHVTGAAFLWVPMSAASMASALVVAWLVNWDGAPGQVLNGSLAVCANLNHNGSIVGMIMSWLIGARVGVVAGLVYSLLMGAVATSVLYYQRLEPATDPTQQPHADQAQAAGTLKKRRLWVVEWSLFGSAIAVFACFAGVVHPGGSIGYWVAPSPGETIADRSLAATAAAASTQATTQAAMMRTAQVAMHSPDPTTAAAAAMTAMVRQPAPEQALCTRVAQNAELTDGQAHGLLYIVNQPGIHPNAEPFRAMSPDALVGRFEQAVTVVCINQQRRVLEECRYTPSGVVRRSTFDMKVGLVDRASGQIIAQVLLAGAAPRPCPATFSDSQSVQELTGSPVDDQKIAAWITKHWVP